MRQIRFLPLLFLLAVSSDIFSQGTLNLRISSVRHAWYRNEQAVFEALVENSGPAALKNIAVTIELPPVEKIERTIDLDAGKSASVLYHVKCSSLKPGDYKLKATMNGNGVSSERLFDVYISQQPNPQRLAMDYWVPLNYWVPDPSNRLDGSLKLLDWGISHGFNTFKVVFNEANPRDKATTENLRTLFETAIRKRVNLGFEFSSTNGYLYKDHPEVFVRGKGVKGAMTQDNQRENDVCLREPLVAETSEKLIREDMRAFSIYPSFYHILINSEFQSSPCYSEDCIQRLKTETGLDLYNYNINPLRPPKTAEEAKKAGVPEKLAKAIPVNGIIENDNPYYRFYMWWWKRGMGDALLNEIVSDVVKEYKKDVITWHDPFRLAPVYGTHKGLDCIGHWNYAHPDPKYSAYVETLIAGARPENQMVMPDVTTWEYQNWLAPTDSGVLIMPPDILRENLWIALSRRPDFLCHYNSTSLNPLRQVDEWHRDPATFDMMTSMSENIYKPFGPFILEMKRTQRKAAILSSAASVLFPETARGGYPNTAIYPFYSLLMMAHVPADVIFDETVSRYGLDGYDILFLHQCETLTRDVYEKILEFKKRGGIVLGDKLLRANIQLDHRFEFDLDHRKRQMADLVVQGKGVTADEDRELMTGYAGEIRKALEGKAEWFVDSDSPEVVLNVLESGPVKYLFIINDKRTYGEKYGQKWKTFHEKGIEQNVTLRIKAAGKDPVLYDVRAHKRIPVQRSGEYITFTRTLGPCDGTIIALYPEELKAVKIVCPDRLMKETAGTITVSVHDANAKSYGTQPVHVILTDPDGHSTDYSDYYATHDGTFRLQVIPAKNDREGIWRISVTDLTSGISSSSRFTVD